MNMQPYKCFAIFIKNESSISERAFVCLSMCKVSHLCDHQGHESWSNHIDEKLTIRCH